MVPFVLAALTGGALPPTVPDGRAAAAAADPLQELRASVTTWEALAERVAGQTDAERAPAMAAVTELATNCPYNRGTFMLLLTLDRELARLDPQALPEGERARFALVVRGVAAQVRVLRTLGGDELPDPIIGEYLAGDFVSRPPMPGGAAFAASLDPIGDTLAVLSQVPGLVQDMPVSTHDRVERAWATLGATVDDDRWFGAVEQWSGAFSGLSVPRSDGPAAAAVSRLGLLLSSHGGQGC